ncbi:MAG: WD40 repeat domain-containing protein, partial [Planctomycetaceae bacterium]
MANPLVQLFATADPSTTMPAVAVAVMRPPTRVTAQRFADINKTTYQALWDVKSERQLTLAGQPAIRLEIVEKTAKQNHVVKHLVEYGDRIFIITGVSTPENATADEAVHDSIAQSLQLFPNGTEQPANLTPLAAPVRPKRPTRPEGSLASNSTSGTASSRPRITRETMPPWSAQADPTPAPIQWPEQIDWQVPISSSGRQHLMQAATPSPFLVIERNGYETDKARLVDLRTGEIAGQLQGKPTTSNQYAVSPDGRFLAVSALKERGRVEIWSWETGQQTQTLQLTENDGLIAWFGFGRPDQLVTARYVKLEGGQEQRIRIDDVVSGAMVREFVVAQPLDFSRIQLSPGGRYLFSLSIAHTAVTAFDLDSGTAAGGIALPREVAAGQHVSPEGLAVSQDGRRIVVLRNGTTLSTLELIDVASGTVSQTILFPGPLSGIYGSSSNYYGPDLIFAEDSDFLMLKGQLLLHLPSARVVWAAALLPNMKSLGLQNSSLKQLVGESIAWVDGPQLKTQVFPWKEIQAAVTKATADAMTRYPGGTDIVVRIDGSPLPTVNKVSPSELLAALKEQVGQLGLTPVEQGNVVLTLSFSEIPGNYPKQVQRITVEANGKVLWGYQTTYFQNT